MTTRTKTKWDESKVREALTKVVSDLGHFPAISELRQIQRNDLCCALGRFGGIVAWAEKMGMARAPSDSDTGWQGEIAFQDLVRRQGMVCERMKAVKHPFDLLIGSALRIDVKAARMATYGRSTGHSATGWFYRIGKAPQADLVVFYQLDTGNFYAVPWHAVPTSNVTISRDGGKYAAYLNNWPLIEKLLASRKAEFETAA